MATKNSLRNVLNEICDIWKEIGKNEDWIDTSKSSLMNNDNNIAGCILMQYTDTVDIIQ